MSINYAPKQVSTDLQDAIAKFLETHKVEKSPRKGAALAARKADKREAVRKAFLDKRELEHNAILDGRG